MLDGRVTLAFSPHRVEALPLAAACMQQHQLIILEEPRNPSFAAMLREELSLDEYLGGMDLEFPMFTRRSCELLRELHAEGREILQIEPFMERITQIRAFFGRDGSPEKIEQGSVYHQVYKAEHSWTGALLDYYETSMGGDFDRVVSSVKAFAREDAARGRLRDALRAEAIADALPANGSTYLEAGELHIGLLGQLREQLPEHLRLDPVYLLEPVIRPLTGRRQAMGPGDLLTLLYAFRPDYGGERADLLAARNLIHVKILAKEEIEGSEDPYPHTQDQIESNRLVEGLSYRACHELYRQIRFRKTREARQVVSAYRAGQRRAASD